MMGGGCRFLICDVCSKIINPLSNSGLFDIASICIYTDVAKLVTGANEE